MSTPLAAPKGGGVGAQGGAGGCPAHQSGCTVTGTHGFDEHTAHAARSPGNGNAQGRRGGRRGCVHGETQQTKSKPGGQRAQHQRRWTERAAYSRAGSWCAARRCLQAWRLRCWRRAGWAPGSAPTVLAWLAGGILLERVRTPRLATNSASVGISSPSARTKCSPSKVTTSLRVCTSSPGRFKVNT